MKRVIIDMDHVMADFTDQYLSWYKEKTGVDVNREKLIGLTSESLAFPDPKLARSLLFVPGFFRTMKVMEGSQAVVKELNEVYDVQIVSSAMEFPQSLIEKYEWLQEHFPFISWQQIAFTGNKKIIKGDYMIDDHFKNLDYFEGERVLFTASHNLLSDKYTRVNNWEEVRALLLPETVKKQVVDSE